MADERVKMSYRNGRSHNRPRNRKRRLEGVPGPAATVGRELPYPIFYGFCTLPERFSRIHGACHGKDLIRPNDCGGHHGA